MSIGASLVLIAIGAILRWGVTLHVRGVNLLTVGDILMIIGVIGLIITTMLWTGHRRRDLVVHERPWDEPPTL